ncbi:formylglycine-generating enzyme family protein [Brevibacillus laterosporus]|uniref:Formylglycine-generating enzyme family protein n=1 Tax=Brevibacillus laterosporus TaxID=1465 RepID=A0A502HIT8_BRELA|nr:formylglycine-generating enzyme family protein [Brevibacillus laterosporus]TPG73178.1 formylglycine-generating enzyme family protein [Brevibacillus laterosporus]TPG91839.1 formylglycine-generating enzyme family protein [Brevibacillus laterosporus]
MLNEIMSYIDYPMVKIPGGEIELRDDRIKRKWKAEIRPFLLAQYPVTTGLYYAITNKSPNSSDGDLKPVVNISWNDAISFCNLLSQKAGLKECYSISNDGENIICDWESNGYRLPSEAEWQYACKAGTTGYRYGELDKIAWYNENSGGNIHEVGRKEPNAWGLYDMLGNVWEWCWDLYDEEAYGSYRIFRGGSLAEEARGCGASCRRRSHPSFCIDDLGFRLAQSL